MNERKGDRSLKNEIKEENGEIRRKKNEKDFEDGKKWNGDEDDKRN